MRARLKELSFTAPSFFWLAIFFLIPTIIVFTYALKPYDLYGSLASGWTLDTLLELYDANLPALAWRTFWISALSTVICVAIALPLGFQFFLSSKKWRNYLLILMVIPFWSSSLIRIFAWKVILHPEGALHDFLVMLGLIHPNTTLLYNSAAILFFTIYTLLPFAVLPIFAAAAKFRLELLETAMDLGATRSQAFMKVFLPGIKKGVVTGGMMVFIAAIGSYVIPDLVGGANSEMLGNKIAQKMLLERNLPRSERFVGHSDADGHDLDGGHCTDILGEEMKSRFCQIITILVTLILYLPIAILIVNSFNESRFGAGWMGFSFKWYQRRFEEGDLWLALRNSLVIGISSTIASTILGFVAAFAIHYYKTPLQKVHYSLVYGPLVIPEVLMGISLLLFFTAIRVPPGLFTVFIAHTTFCVGYVTMVLLAKLQNFDFSAVEAAQDLGANSWTAFRRVLLPLLAPALWLPCCFRLPCPLMILSSPFSSQERGRSPCRSMFTI